MGKIKNFKVELPSEFIKDKKWRDDNVKAGNVEEYKFLKAEIESIPGEIQFPVELCSLLHKIEVNQKRIEEKMDLLNAALKQITSGNGSFPQRGQSNGSMNISPSMKGNNSSRIKWGNTEEEQKLTLFSILEEAEENGVALRTTEFKKIGGKYSTVVSYSYKIFGSWKKAIQSYKQNYQSQN